MRLHSLIDALQESLEQELFLIGALSSELYRAPAVGHFSSSVGMHLRHNLDHFEAFFNGLENGEVDYESRSRKTQIEDIPGLAEEAIADYLEKLDHLRAADEKFIQVREESEVGIEERRWLDSSVGRELQFLLGHTVHHNAIIAMIVDRHGIHLPKGFGVAPSTQRHVANSEVVEG